MSDAQQLWVVVAFALFAAAVMALIGVVLGAMHTGQVSRATLLTTWVLLGASVGAALMSRLTG